MNKSLFRLAIGLYIIIVVLWMIVVLCAVTLLALLFGEDVYSNPLVRLGAATAIILMGVVAASYSIKVYERTSARELKPSSHKEVHKER